jgi:SAM-dependent methyltransferase
MSETPVSKPLRLTFRTLGYYSIRKSVEQALIRNLPTFKGVLLDVGCGNQPYRGFLMNSPSKATKYIGVDIDYKFASVKPDLYWDGKKIPLDDNTADTVILTEVLEHCPDPKQVLSEIFRVLKPGGVLFLTIPFLWMLHEVPYDEYRYTPFSLKRFLELAGFATIDIQSSGGWNASLAQMLGLWIEYKKRPKLIRIFLKLVLAPLYLLLLYTDKKNDSFEDLSMVTGLNALCIK